MNPGPLGPKPRIIPLDQAADCTEWIGNGIQTQLCEHCRRFAHCQFIWRGYVVNAGPVFCHSTAGMQFTRLFPNGTALWYPNTSAAWIWDGQWHYCRHDALGSCAVTRPSRSRIARCVFCYVAACAGVVVALCGCGIVSANVSEPTFQGLSKHASRTAGRAYFLRRRYAFV